MRSLVRDYRNSLVNAHPNVRYFFLAVFLSQLSGGFFWVLYNLYIKTLGLPDTVAGACVSASSVASALFLVPAGILSDRFGRKRVIIAGGLLSGVTSLVQPFLASPALLIAGSFCAGMFGAVIWVSILPLLAENTEKEERIHLFSINFSIGLVAQVIGGLSSGVLSEWFGHLHFSPVDSVRWTLVIGALVGTAALIPILRITESPRSTGGRGTTTGFRQLMAHIREERSQFVLIGKFTIAATFIGFGAGLVVPYLNLYFAERFTMSKASIAVVIGMAQAVTAFTMFIGPPVAKRFGPVKAVVLVQMLSIPFLLITGWTTNALLASGAVVIRNALMNSAGPIQDSVMMALVSERVRGFAVSAGQTMFTLGWAVMGPVSTAIVHRHGPYTGYAIVFTATAVLYLFGSTFYGWAFGKYEKQVYEQTEHSVTA